MAQEVPVKFLVLLQEEPMVMIQYYLLLHLPEVVEVEHRTLQIHQALVVGLVEAAVTTILVGRETHHLLHHYKVMVAVVVIRTI
ncbi:MAG: hypothetical protein EB119_09425, partial [Synechococcaceae bacterium WBB_34_004]|nr:hypothetical protein [Synechococcaceae bacterium WBB_34_004]